MIYINDFNYYFENLFLNSSSPLNEIIQYSVLNGGKRLRPRLLLATFNSCLHQHQTDIESRHELALRAACAVEILHSASLIHDDLPIFDNAAERRGKASVHVKYGEQIALLTGDTLIAKSSEIIAETINRQYLSNEIIDLIINLNKAASKLCEGQSLEFNNTLSSDETEYYHKLKTSSLFSFATTAGGIINGYKDLNSLDILGSNIGSIYQLIDDLYDSGIQTNLKIDKPLNQDQNLKRPNFVLLNGVEKTRRQIFMLYNDIDNILASLPNPQPLKDLANEFLQLIK